MTSKSALKSPFCIGRSLASAASPCFISGEDHLARTATIRSASKNICSVRQRPIP